MKRKFALTALITLLAVSLSTNSFAAVKIGDPAPDFSLDDINGKMVSLSTFRGKVVLLNFWGTFCPPCRAEMPSLNRVYLDLKDKGFTIIGLSVDRSEEPVRSLVSSNRIEFPIAIDKGKDVYYKKYATFALPLTYLIDKRGVVTEVFYGKEEWDSADMKQKITALLEQK